MRDEGTMRVKGIWHV